MSFFIKSTSKLVEENFHALTHKNFRYFFLGQCASLIGTWMQSIGQSWLVLSITNSPFLLGVLGMVQFIPITFFSLFAGVVIDKYPKKRILVFTQTASMVFAFLLSIMVFTGSVKYVYILIMGFLLGCINCIDMPARQSFTIEIAGKEDLINAIALNSATFNLARILGPSIGAIVMAYFGTGWCFFFNGLSYLAVIFGLFHIKTVPYIRKNIKDNRVFDEIKDGLKYIKNSEILFETILMILVIGIFGFNYNILVPSFTKLVLHQGEKVYGVLMSLLGLGSFIGAIMASVRSRGGIKRKVLFISSGALAIMLILNGLNTNFIVISMLLAVTGVFNIQFATTANSTLQLNSKDEYRGRVMSVYSFVFAGASPLGSLFAGTICDKMGPSKCFLLSGILILVLIVVIKIYFNRKSI